MKVAYLDESQRKGLYVVAALAVDQARVAEVRRLLRCAAPPGRTRRHFVRESDVSRRKLLALFRTLPGCRVIVHVVGRQQPVVAQRATAITSLVPDLIDLGLSKLVLDNVEEHQRRRDRQTLTPLLRGQDVEHHHEPPHSSEPMLWVPDAVAWCAGRREWRTELAGWVVIRTSS